MLKHVSYRGSSSSFNRNSDYCNSNRQSFKSDVSDKNFKNSHLSLCNTTNGSDEYEDTVSLQNFRPEDNMSISSAITMSHNSLAGSRYSSTLSLTDPNAIPVKVYLHRLRPDMSYKTLPLSSATTCKQMIASLLAKFRLRHRDPNLFFVMMEVSVRGASDAAPTKSVLVLDDNARPAELQQCRPKGEARFSVGVRQGGLIRVHDSLLMAGSQYKSLMVSHQTTTTELIQLLLSCYNRTDNPNLYTIHEVCKNPFFERTLSPSSYPMEAQAKWSSNDKTNWSFVLRRSIHYTIGLKAKLPWRRSLDQSSTDTESDLDDHNTTRASIMSTCSIMSSSSTSSGVSSSSLASLSSGVSSDDCFMSTPVSTPVKLPKFIADNFPPLKTTPIKAPVDCKQLTIWQPRHATRKSRVKSTENIYINIERTRLPRITDVREKVPSSVKPPLITRSNSEEAPARRSKTPPVIIRRKSLPENRKPATVSPGSRPPQPVPRTLFFPLRLRSGSKELKDCTNDSGYLSTDTTKSPVKAVPISYGVLSHPNHKKASIRSLSKSFANLCAISPSSDNVNLLPSKAHLIQEATVNRLLSSKSSLNLSHPSSCDRHCQSCFYI